VLVVEALSRFAMVRGFRIDHQHSSETRF